MLYCLKLFYLSIDFITFVVYTGYCYQYLPRLRHFCTIAAYSCIIPMPFPVPSMFQGGLRAPIFPIVWWYCPLFLQAQGSRPQAGAFKRGTCFDKLGRLLHLKKHHKVLSVLMVAVLLLTMVPYRPVVGLSADSDFVINFGD